MEVSSQIDDYLQVEKIALELSAKDLMENELMKARVNWIRREPTALEINRIVKGYTTKVKNIIDFKLLQEMSKDFVRKLFKNDYGDDQYKVSIWRKIRDFIPKFGTPGDYYDNRGILLQNLQ